jgi:hypothetical protein
MVINFIAPPGCGKSTAAHGLVYMLKKAGKRAEMAHEYAKDLVFDENFRTLARQEQVFAEQHARIQRLQGAEYIVTDSPIILSLLYADHYPDAFKDYVRLTEASYESMYYLVKREHDYETYGRVQNESQSDAMYSTLIDLLRYNNIPFKEVSSLTAAEDVFKELISL